MYGRRAALTPAESKALVRTMNLLLYYILGIVVSLIEQKALIRGPVLNMVHYRDKAQGPGRARERAFCTAIMIIILLPVAPLTASTSVD